ncbi:MAG: LysR family transcriptional regulator [Candidatus Binatia bacterium]
MIETKQLKIFRTIVEVGSFTGAGERLGVSQSAISQQVHALEEELGVPLILRTGKSLRITPAGDMLLHCARQVLDKIDETRRHLEEQARGRSGVVRIGTPEPPCNYLLPEVLVELKRRFPRIDVRVISGHTSETRARLLAGELDVALLPLPVEAEKLRTVEVGRDELVAIVPPDHHWTQLPFVTARDLEKEPLLVYDRASQITDLTFAFLLAEGVFPRIAAEVDHLEALKDLARRRLGIGVVPAWSARREIAAGSLVPVRLGPTGITRAWGVLHPDLQPYPATLRALVQLFAEALPLLFARAA